MAPLSSDPTATAVGDGVSGEEGVGAVTIVSEGAAVGDRLPLERVGVSVGSVDGIEVAVLVGAGEGDKEIPMEL